MAIPPLVLRIYADSTGVKAGVAQAQGQVNGLRASMTRNAGLIKTALIAGVVVGIGKSIEAASNLNEQMNRTKEVFEGSSASVIAFSENTATGMGIAQSETLQAASNFGAMFDSARIAEAESARMSTTMVELASDMASLNDQDPTEMLQRLQGGLAGMARPLRQFGVFISAARVEEEALRMGLERSSTGFTDAQKVMARYNIILQDTAKQQGDFQRTLSESLPNQLRVLRARVIDVAAAFGKALLPVARGVVQALNVLVPIVSDLAPLLVAVAAGFAAIWVVGKIALLAGAIGAASTAMTAIGVAALAAAGPIGIVVGLIAGAVLLERTSSSAFDRQTERIKALGVGAEQAGKMIDNHFNASLRRIPGDLRSANMAVYDHITALENGGNAARAAGGQAEYYARTLEGEATASGKATKSAKDLRQARLALAGGLLGLVAQMNTLKEAQATVNQLENAGKRGTQEYKDAKLVLLQEVVASKSALAEYGDQLKEEGQTYPEVRAKLVELGKQYGLTRDDVLDVLSVVKETNAAWAQVPKNVRTNYSIDLTGDVNAANALGFDFGQRAGGGPVSAGTPYIVGEAGPELFVPNGSGQIIPNDKLPAGGGETIVHVYVGEHEVEDIVVRAQRRAAMKRAPV